jgi:hypothetical protein
MSAYVWLTRSDSAAIRITNSFFFILSPFLV